MTPEESALAWRLRGHVQKLAGEIGERNVWAYQALDAAAEYVAATLRDAGYRVSSQEYLAAGKNVRNLDAELRGSDQPDEILVVGAHYDAVRGCPAANDNASGVAALLEIAKVVADTRARRSVRFVAFVNEEPPFFQTSEMGSVVYARRCKRLGENVVGMLSLETIGCYSDEPGSQSYPPPYHLFFPSTGNFIAFVSNEPSGAFLSRVVDSFRRHTSFPCEAAAAPESVHGIGLSDHWSFWREGYPAAMVTDTAFFRYPHYHTPQDTPDKLDYERMARVVAGLTRVVGELSLG